jgi:hypothetical protein
MAAVTRRQYKGAAASTTITTGINPADTTCSLAATTGWPATASVPFYVVIEPGTSAEEKCSATISGSTLTLTRGADDTTAVSHGSGATIYPVFSADEADEANLFASTMTTRGDLLTMGSGPTVGRVALGTSGYAVTSNGTDVVWGQVAAAGLASDAVTTAKILDANVTADKLASDAVTQVKIADRAVGSAELTNLTLNAQTGTTYTLVLTDAQKLVTLSNASSITATIPPNSSVAFTIGDQVNLMQIGAGQVTVAAGAGVTLQAQGSKVKLNGVWSTATLIKIATDTWVLVGNTAV